MTTSIRVESNVIQEQTHCSFFYYIEGQRQSGTDPARMQPHYYHKQFQNSAIHYEKKKKPLKKGKKHAKRMTIRQIRE